MAHNRKLVLGAVALVKARVRGDIEAMSVVRDEVEGILISSGWFPGAPFQWVSIIFRYGLKNDERPEINKVNKKYGDLPLAIEIDINEILDIQKNKNALKSYLKEVTITCLLVVAENFDLPSNYLLEAQNVA